jgi:hypothetical protein
MHASVDETCAAAFTQYVGVPIEQSQLTYGYFSPSPGSDWNSGDREIVSAVENADDTPQSGSERGSAS